MKKKDRNENNFNPQFVIYKGVIYETGNRYHTLIELYIDKMFYKTVKMSKVKVIKNK